MIYTPENPDAPVVDQSLLDEIPSDVTILKLPIFEPSRAISIFGGNNSTGRTGAESKSGGKKSIINEFTRWVRGNVFIPDARAMWIKPSGRRETPGRPVTWITDYEFLRHFGLESIKDLPKVDELESIIL